MCEENNNSKTKDIIEAATGLVKAVPIYEDAIQPAAKEIGKTLQTTVRLVNLALQPIRKFILKHEEIEEFIASDVAEKLQYVPQENIIEPSITIAGPTLEAMRFAGNENVLRNMYANLLASSMDSTSASDAHPAFVEIIKQLTPGEARLLVFLSQLSSFPEIYSYKAEGQNRLGMFFAHNRSSREDDRVRKGFVKIVKPKASGEDLMASLDNLLRLKLLEINTRSSQRIGNRFGGSSLSSKKNNTILTVRKTGFVGFSAFGIKFVRTCVLEKKEESDS